MLNTQHTIYNVHTVFTTTIVCRLRTAVWGVLWGVLWGYCGGYCGDDDDIVQRGVTIMECYA